MTISKQNFSIVAGDTAKLTVSVTDPTGAPLDLTGATIRWAMGRGVGIPPLLEKSSEDNSITINGTSFDINLDPLDTQNLRGAFYHEAEITDASGEVSTVMTGTATVRGSLII